jgi:hypothetical protein
VELSGDGLLAQREEAMTQQRVSPDPIEDDPALAKFLLSPEI